MSINFRPLADRVVVRRAETEFKTPGGIILTDAHTQKPQEGEILAVGPGRYENGQLVPPTVAVGDRVLFGKWSGTEVKIEGEDLMIMPETDILGILR